MSNPWFRLYSEFATDPKVQMMPEAMQRRYIMLMCMRCSDVTVTLCDEEIAFQLRISHDELAETKALFIKKGFISEDWNLLNWDKRQFKSDHDISGAERQRRFREKKKQKRNELSNVTVTLPDTDTDTDTDTDKKRERTARATRMPADMDMPDEWGEFCKQERPDLIPREVFSKFKDYWTAKPGKAGTKLDWLATWRNWVREEKGRQKPVAKEPAWRTEQRNRTIQAVPAIAERVSPATEFFEMEVANVSPLALGR